MGYGAYSAVKVMFEVSFSVIQVEDKFSPFARETLEKLIKFLEVCGLAQVCLI